MRLLLFLYTLIIAAMPVEAADPERNREVLDEVFDIVAKYHYDKDFRSAKLPELEKAAPQIIAAENDAELAARINALLLSFGDSHQNLMPPPSQESIEALTAPSGAPHHGRLGLMLGEAGGKVFVLRSEQESPAYEAGIRPGMEISAVNGHAITPDKNALYGWAMIAGELLRHAGADGKVRVTAAGGKEFLIAPQGVVETFQVGAMPPLPLEYFSELLSDGKTGYISFNAFTPEIIGKVRRDVESRFKDCKALIIDLRCNVGGLIFLCENLAGWVAPGEIPFGSIEAGGSEFKPLSYPQKRGFKGKLAVLIDRNSYSTAEAFAAGIQDAGAGIVAGYPSAGMCLPSSFTTLKHGFVLQSVMGDFRRAGGKPLEKLGVTPEVAPEPLPASGEWRDAVLSAALSALSGRQQ